MYKQYVWLSHSIGNIPGILLELTSYLDISDSQLFYFEILTILRFFFLLKISDIHLFSMANFL